MADSDDSDVKSADNFEQAQQVAAEVATGPPTGEELFMCCCKAHKPHDETMKFVTKTKDDNKELLQKILFNGRPDGMLEQQGFSDKTYRSKILVLQKQQLVGRMVYAHKVVKFLTDPGK